MNTANRLTTGLSAITSVCILTLAFAGASMVMSKASVSKTQLADPSNLRLAAYNDTEMALLWDDNSQNEQAFEIWYKASTQTEWSRMTVDANCCFATVPGLSPGTSYEFRLRALGNNGRSEFTPTELAEIPV